MVGVKEKEKDEMNWANCCAALTVFKVQRVLSKSGVMKAHVLVGSGTAQGPSSAERRGQSIM